MLVFKVLIIGISLILIIILFCEILGWLSEKNRHRHRDLTSQLPRIDTQIDHQQKQLSRFNGVSAQHYRTDYDSGEMHLLQAESKRDKIKQILASTSHPFISTGQLSTIYFLKNPLDVRTEWHISNQLGTMEQLTTYIRFIFYNRTRINAENTDKNL